MKHKIGTMGLGLFLSFGMIGATSAGLESNKALKVGHSFSQRQVKTCKGQKAAKTGIRISSPALVKSDALKKAVESLDIAPYTSSYHNSEKSDLSPYYTETADLTSDWNAAFSAASDNTSWTQLQARAKFPSRGWAGIVKNAFDAHVENNSWSDAAIDWREDILKERSYYAMISLINAIAKGNTYAMDMVDLFGNIYGTPTLRNELMALGLATGIYNANNSDAGATTYLTLYGAKPENQTKYNLLGLLSLWMQVFSKWDVKDMYDTLQGISAASTSASVAQSAIRTFVYHSALEDYYTSVNTPGGSLVKRWYPENQIYKA